MKRVNQGVEFHQERNDTEDSSSTRRHHQQLTSHELDAKDMRAILTQLFVKTLDTKKRQKDAHTNLRHHYEGVFKESANIDKPPIFDEADFIRQELLSLNKPKVEATTGDLQPTAYGKRLEKLETGAGHSPRDSTTFLISLTHGLYLLSRLFCPSLQLEYQEINTFI
jgi:hypothetical protein